MKHLLILIALLLGLTAPGAQAAPRLLDTLNGEESIRLQSLHIGGEIGGGMAQTTVRLVFFNPNPRPLEGRLQFPLRAGQQVTAFALDIDGQLRPAVPVEKAKGRQVFEAIARRQVDPGLLEVTQGNNFQLRIYPIPARGTRTVELKYAEALPKIGADWIYRLPLAYGEQPRDFDLTLRSDGTAAPRASGALGDIHFSRNGNDFQAHIAKSRFAPSGLLQLSIPASPQPRTYTQVQDGDTFFLAQIPVSAARTARVLPKIVGLLWDSSGSGAGRDHGAELAVLDRYFKALGHAEVRLIRLRDRAEATQIFHIAHGDSHALRQALQATIYDGASALSAWQPQADVGEYLLVSDGLMNYGAQPFPKLAAGQRLYALDAAPSADTSRLSAWAQHNGGRLIRIDAQAPDNAANALLHDGARLEILNASGAGDVQISADDTPQNLIRISGRLLNPKAQLQLRLQQNGKTQALTLPIGDHAPAHPLAAYLWASARLHTLAAEYELHRAEIGRIGQRFGIATRETSLIVLDRLEDYVRYDIAPPPAYQAAFDALKMQRGLAQDRKRTQHLERIVRAFQEKVRWWEKSYPKDTPPPAPEPAQAAALEMARQNFDRAEQHNSAQRAAPAMAAPAPAAALVGSAMPAQEQKIEAGATPSIGIALKKWTPDAPYIARLQNARSEDLYAVYLDEKPSYRNSSAFFLDAADLLLEKNQRDLALRVLSNLAEMDLENRQVLRILGYRLLQAGAPALAIPVFAQVRQLAAEEPQSFRDLGLAYAAAEQYQAAVDQLNQVVLRPWDERFADIELIALAELNAIVAHAPTALDTSRVDPRLLKNLPLDLRAVLTWDADNSDMDLWVTDPNGEKCYYGHRLTYQGGAMSRDFTGGYGPEAFSLRHAKPGKYKIEVNFFGSRQQLVAGATTLQVKLTTGFGTPKAMEQSVTLRLKERAETVFVGEFEVKP
jgi:Ca-activated chloride channel family protein